MACRTTKRAPAPRAMLSRSTTGNSSNSPVYINSDDEGDGDLAMPDAADPSSYDDNANGDAIGPDAMSFEMAVSKNNDDDDFGRSEDEGIEQRFTKKRRLNSPPPPSKYNLAHYQAVSQQASEDDNRSALGSSQSSYLPPDFSNSRTSSATTPTPLLPETKADKSKRVKGKATRKTKDEAAHVKADKVTAKKSNVKKPSVAKRAAPKPSILNEAEVEDDESVDDYSDCDEPEDELDAPEMDYNMDDEVEVDTKKSTKNKKGYNFDPGYDASLSPMNTIEKIFAHLAQRLVEKGMRELTNKMQGRPLKVGTFCSGTESPILAMMMLQPHFKVMGIDFNFKQHISAEIKPAKSAFIEKNFDSPINACDITEISMQGKRDPKWTKEWTLTTAYGGKAKVPRDLDLLVAGFACDDFSILNTKRKTLDAKGESGDTFYATLEYIDRYRPKMVILENVIGAPWIHAKLRKKKGTKEVIGIDEQFRLMGYEAVFIKLDTKDHYLPHTRQRGYMVCILRAAFNGSPAKLAKAAEGFLNLVNELKRPASVPMEAMMLPFDSPLLEVTARDDGGNKRAVMPWEKCKLGHQDYVLKHNLGTSHPITLWDANGFKVLPDYFKPTAGFTDRVLDSIDISHLRNIILKLIDDRRFLELSQNVYRFEDANRTGIVGCVTPNNFLFLTQRGGRVSGLEALISQGYNPNWVNTSNMSEALLHDLSGNAMTSTVVGTFMFAALIQFREVFNFDGGAKQIEDAEPQSDHLGRELLESHDSHPAKYLPVSVEHITALAKATVRLCVCEGQNHIVSRQIQQCRVCKTTSCVKCGRNPEHCYEPILIERKEPVHFVNTIKEALPFSINLSGLASDETTALLNEARKRMPFGFAQGSWNGVIDKMQEAFASTVSYRDIRRAESFQAIYDSSSAMLKLQVSSAGVEWLLYANVPDEPLGTDMGRYLRRFPIARMQPTGDDIMKGLWQFWDPRQTPLHVTITSSGPLEQSFENERGLVEFSSTFVYPNVSISLRGNEDPDVPVPDILGDYVRFSGCGQAFNSLHSRKALDGQKPMLLFFNHHLGSGNPADHFFSFSTDITRKLYAENLAAVCNLPPSWRQPKVVATETISGFMVNGTPVASYVGSQTEDVDIMIDGHWVDLPNHNLELNADDMITYRRLPAKVSHLESTCGHKRAVFEMMANAPLQPSLACRMDRWTLINRANKTTFWKEYLFMLEKELILTGHRESDNSWIRYHDDTTECLACAPPPTSMQWTFNVKKSRNGKEQQKQVPIEDPEQASFNERAIKNRPSAIQSMVRFSDNRLEFRIAVNPATLVHRARASILLGGSCSRTGCLVDDVIDTSYRIITDNGKAVLPPVKEFTLRSTHDVVADSTIATPNSPFQGYSKSPAALQFQQAKALTWMLSQENDTKPFDEQAISEAFDDDLGYRIEAKATRKVKIAGGILAQAVGFGKTILILSIIAKNLAILEKEVKHAPHVIGAIPTAATLVLVPPHLVDQWGSEAKAFVDQIFKDVIVVKTFKKLQGLTVEDYKNAKLVIAAWDVCTSPSYRKAFAQFAGKVECDLKAPPRAKRQWYEDALKAVESNIEKFTMDPDYVHNPTTTEELLKSQFEESVKEANQHSRFVPSKHVTGSKYVSAETRAALSEGPQAGGKRKRDVELVPAPRFESVFDFSVMAGLGIDGLKIPLFEFMKWGRVVIDEHTFANLDMSSMLEFFKCFKIWLLSGTPRLDNFHDVKAMATLLGVNLGRDDHSIMKSDVLRKKMSQLTSSEKFFMYQESASVAWQRNREDHAQAFLDHFVRQDFVDVSNIKCKEMIVGISQSAAEKAMYMELEDYVIANDFQRKATKATSDSKAQLVKEATSESEDGRVALLLKSSAFGIQIKEGDATAKNALEMCELIQETRTREYHEMLDRFSRELTKAHWLDVQARAAGESCVQYNKWVTRATANLYGDHFTTVDIRSTLSLLSAEYDFENWKNFYRKPTDTKSELPLYPEGQTATHGKTHLSSVVAALRSSASKLNKYGEELVIRKRSLRAFESVRSIQCGRKLICSKCGRQAKPNNITLLGQCGHLFCNNCSIQTVCGVVEGKDKCTATVAPHQRISCASLGTDTGFHLDSELGSKLDYIVNLIQNKIPGHNIPVEDKVLVFAQFAKTQEKLEAALKKRNITFLTLTNKASASKNLKQFQDGKSGIKVLIMMIGNETASGSNLTVARHVIFLQTFYTTGSSARQEYDSAMTQAIGRARRLNQEGTVMVYELLATNTIEVDYRQHRGRCILQPQNGSDVLAQAKLPVGSAQLGPLASSIAHRTSFDG
ncbi:hypothetical protein IFR05_008100 [Cadophora sp. M221]|nr:hypothetical protein IFR05_008100 [Cadophora sp. M221]